MRRGIAIVVSVLVAHCEAQCRRDAEELAACSTMSLNAACSYVRGGATTSGTCKNDPNCGLHCAGGTGGGPTPSGVCSLPNVQLSSCTGANEGDSCSFTYNGVFRCGSCGLNPECSMHCKAPPSACSSQPAPTPPAASTPTPAASTPTPAASAPTSTPGSGSTPTGTEEGCTMRFESRASCEGRAVGSSCKYYVGKQGRCGVCEAGSDGCAYCGSWSECQPDNYVSCTAAQSEGIRIEEPCKDTTIVPAKATMLSEPVVLQSEGGTLTFELTVEQFRLDAGGAFQMNTRAFCYNGVCSAPGPTIKCKPGDTVSIKITNKLGGYEDDDVYVLGDFGKPNSTNFHTHGLHVDPSEDNPVYLIEPGSSKTYTLHIPSDHMPGTHWYHSHAHGASALQVMGGLIGAIIVEPPTSFALPAAYTAMEASLLVVTHVSLCSCNPSSDPFRIIEYQELHGRARDKIPLDPVVGTEGVTDVMLVNGQRQPTVEMAPGEWHRFEVVNAVGDTFLELEVRSKVELFNTEEDSSCTMRLLALDGVFLTAGTREESTVYFAPASRASVAVMCPTTGTYYLQSNPNSRAADHEALFLQNLVTLSVSGDSRTMQVPVWDGDAIVRPNYLMDLQQHVPYQNWELGVEQTGVSGGGAWLGVGKDCALVSFGREAGETPNPNTVGSCPHIAFGFPAGSAGRRLENYPYRHVGRLCDVVDLTLNGRGKTPHPMHIHVHHFQMLSFESDRGVSDTSFQGWGIVGDYRDTFPALAGATRVRYVLDGHGGNTMVHCHFLPHEDMGMMDRFYVLPADTAEEPCTAWGGGNTGLPVATCTDLVPTAAFNDEYPSVSSTCSSFRQGTAHSGARILEGGSVPSAAATHTSFFVGAMILLLLCLWL